MMKILFKETLLLRLFAWKTIPLLWWIQPSLVQNDNKKTILKVPLTRRTKNHLNVMYFGALAMGGEACVGIRAMETIQRSKKPVDFLFNDFQCEFLKKSKGDVHFICDQVDEVQSFINEVIAKNGERLERKFSSYAIVPSVDANEVVARFSVTMTSKLRTKK